MTSIDSRTRATAKSVVLEAAFDRATELLHYGHADRATELFEAVDILKRPTDSEAIEAIYTILDADDRWYVEDLELIAAVIGSTGRDISSW